MTSNLRSVLNTEEAVRDVVTQEVMSLEPRAFRAISVDIDSIEIKRESGFPGRQSTLHELCVIVILYNLGKLHI